MKKIFMLFAFCLFTFNIQAQNITIIESLTGNFWAVQDTVWSHVATGMGLNPSIVPQSTLSSISNLSTTDALIISSGTIALPPAYLQTLREYVLGGGSVYVQSEYYYEMPGSITFDSLMITVGADFTWNSIVSGFLVPMNIFGGLSTTPNIVGPLDYFNYGLSGSGTGVEPFLEYNGAYFGFCYVDPSAINGAVITISDEDWAWNNASPELMENILSKLVNNGVFTALVNLSERDIRIYPNPTNGELFIDLGVQYKNARFSLRDLNGRLIQSEIYNGSSPQNMSIQAPAGVYLLEIIKEDRKSVTRIVKN